MVVGLCDKCLLYSVSVTKRPAVIPLSGTNHSVSENRSFAGLVQICSWSCKNSFPNPLRVRGVDTGYSDSGSLAIFFSGLVFATSVVELLGFLSASPSFSACRGAELETLAVSVRLDAAQPTASTKKQMRLMNIPRHGWIYATAK